MSSKLPAGVFSTGIAWLCLVSSVVGILCAVLVSVSVVSEIHLTIRQLEKGVGGERHVDEIYAWRSFARCVTYLSSGICVSLGLSVFLSVRELLLKRRLQQCVGSGDGGAAQ